jgi:hypothetical protein
MCQEPESGVVTSCPQGKGGETAMKVEVSHRVEKFIAHTLEVIHDRLKGAKANIGGYYISGLARGLCFVRR